MRALLVVLQRQLVLLATRAEQARVWTLEALHRLLVRRWLRVRSRKLAWECGASHLPVLRRTVTAPALKLPLPR